MTLQSKTPAPRDLTPSLKPGFTDPVFDAQATFRAVLLSTAYPGKIVSLDRDIPAPHPLAPAAAGLCLTLMDFETSTWLDQPSTANEAADWLRFHCGLPVTDDTTMARFAVITKPHTMPRLFQFHPGEPEYPDRSTTLIIQVPSFTAGAKTVWRGPGIKSEIDVSIAGLPSWFWSDWDLNRELYPRGIDVIFICGNSLIGMPRTIQIMDEMES